MAVYVDDMRELPILFSAPMVRAILEGRKTVTRRMVKFNIAGRIGPLSNQWHVEDPGATAVCPYGQPGDRLWVRESFWKNEDGFKPTLLLGAKATQQVEYDASLNDLDREELRQFQYKRKPSIHMPRWASRITLEVTGMRVERLQDITSDQILAEGVQIPTTPAGGALIDISTKHGPAYFLPALNGNSTDDLLRAHWAALWVAINGIDSWNTNPWVWVVEFKRIQQAAAGAIAA
jgi:hypothetical protein